MARNRSIAKHRREREIYSKWKESLSKTEIRVPQTNKWERKKRCYSPISKKTQQGFRTLQYLRSLSIYFENNININNNNNQKSSTIKTKTVYFFFKF